MTPYSVSLSSTYPATVLAVTNLGNFANYGTQYLYGTRPVINLKANVQLIGSGTTSNPYKIEGV